MFMGAEDQRSAWKRIKNPWEEIELLSGIL
jgi:hypothetical protein